MGPPKIPCRTLDGEGDAAVMHSVPDLFGGGGAQSAPRNNPKKGPRRTLDGSRRAAPEVPGAPARRRTRDCARHDPQPAASRLRVQIRGTPDGTT